MSNKEAAFHPLFNGIPALRSYIEAATGKQAHYKADVARSAHLPVYRVILDQAADLPVKHPVKLGHKYNVITVMPVLGEKGKPALTPYVLPLPAIKEKLRFIYDKQQFTFLQTAAQVLGIAPGEPKQAVRGQTVI